MTELVTLLDGGDPVSAALLAQNVAIATGAVNAVAERENQRTATSQDEDSSSGTSEPSSPASAPSEVATQSFITPTSEPELASPNASAPHKTPKAASLSAVLNNTDPTNIAELKALLQEMVEQQARATEQMLLLQREERRLEAERRERELEVEREEREKDRQALTATVMEAMKTFLEQNGRKD